MCDSSTGHQMFLFWSLGLWYLAVTFPLRDKSREKQRKKNLQARKAARAQQEEQKTQRLKKEANSTVTAMRKKTAKQRRATQLVEDDDEITREYRLMKKLKKGAINENEFAKLTGTEDLLSDIWLHGGTNSVGEIHSYVVVADIIPVT